MAYLRPLECGKHLQCQTAPTAIEEFLATHSHIQPTHPLASSRSLIQRLSEFLFAFLVTTFGISILS